MDKMHRANQPWVYGLLSALVLGLTSFFIWLLRLILRPAQGTVPPHSLAGQFQAGDAADARPVMSATVAASSSAEGMNPDLAATGKIASPPEAVSPPQIESNMASDKPNSWTAPTRYMAGAGIFLFFLWLINYSRQSLTLLIFAALIAILAQPLIQLLQRRLRFSRGLAVVFTYLLIAALIAILPILLIPNIINGINALINYDWHNLINLIVATLDNAAAQVSTTPFIGGEFAASLTALSQFIQGSLTSNPEPITTDISTALNQLGETIGVLGSLVGPAVSGILSLIFMLMISLQMSLASGEIKGWLLILFPDHFKEEIGQLLDRILLAWNSFLRGEFTLMVVMGLLTWILNLLLGTPQALLLGFLAGLLEVVPSLGPILAAIPAAILAVLFGSSMFPGLDPWIFMLIVIIGYVLLQEAENELLVPKILGGAVSLPSVAVLIGVTIAGATAGIAGVFLATPMMATGKELLMYVNRKINQEPEIKPPPDVDKPSFIEQVRDFLGRNRLPSGRAGQDKGNDSKVVDISS